VKAHKGWSMESVILNSEVLREFENELTSSPTDGVYVHGFYLQNACWDRRASKLTDSKSNVSWTGVGLLIYC
jgi:Dynein heavy chain C-terminal domain